MAIAPIRWRSSCCAVTLPCCTIRVTWVGKQSFRMRVSPRVRDVAEALPEQFQKWPQRSVVGLTAAETYVFDLDRYPLISEVGLQYRYNVPARDFFKALHAVGYPPATAAKHVVDDWEVDNCRVGFHPAQDSVFPESSTSGSTDIHQVGQAQVRRNSG